MSADPAAEGWSPRPPQGFTGLTGPLWSRPGGDGWAYGVLADERHANGHGIVHGGMLVTLLDNTLGITVSHATGRRPGVTMQLNTQFLSAARPGEFLEARGEVLRLAHSVAFVRGTIHVGDRLVAAGDGVWKLLSERPAAG
ncbi:PaaI family thioesterase [Roseomonas nepalensis]|uniref:PaaI family thioesterase n=1 Tax=Muricoccus nepalensis TaxID=1854500 RepID=A0A502GA50_9PROT|nr:PaaI family thioesterase [Roseomonas nepalensis]TPG59047.1 PaaI family thioesterase [Roseomonas nepalensis]